MQMKKIWFFINKYKVISGLAVVFITRALDYFFSLHIYSSIFKFLCTEYVSPLWWLFFISLAPALLLKFYARIKNSGWKRYKLDDFYGVRWSWFFDDSKLAVNLMPRCPKCNYGLTFLSRSSYDIVPKYVLKCVKCNFTSQEYDGYYDELVNLARKAIEGRLFTGEYKLIIKKYKL